MSADEKARWMKMCGWDVLAVTTTRATDAACHAIQGFIDRCAQLGHVFDEWRIAARCRECAALLPHRALERVVYTRRLHAKGIS